MSINGRSVKAEEGGVKLSSKTSIDIDHTLATASCEIEFTAPVVKVLNLFASTTNGVDFMASENNRSWLTSIRVTPSNSLGLSYSLFMQGDLQLDAASTNGLFLALGASTVEFFLRKI